MAILKATLSKTINGIEEHVYPRTAADIVEYNDSMSVKEKIDSLETRIGVAVSSISDKVTKQPGMGLSHNDFTDTLLNKLNGIETGAQVNTITGVKGSAESSYRTGNITISPANLGITVVNNTTDANKRVAYAASAGNASTVNGLTVQSAVPANAKFTDTLYTHPSYTAHNNGLYKFSVDNTGHVVSVSEVSLSDITGMGINNSDTKYGLSLSGHTVTLVENGSTKSVTIPDNDTTYSNFSRSAAGLVPSPGGNTTTRYLREDGSWVVPPNDNTSYSVFSRTASGLVPQAPSTNGTTKYLREDGTWQVPPDTNTNTTYVLERLGSGKNGDGTIDTDAMISLRDSKNYTKNIYLKSLNSNLSIGIQGSDVITFNVTGGGSTYSNFSRTAAGLVPAAPSGSGTTKYLREDGNWVVPPNTNTTYSVFNEITDGLVPKTNTTVTYKYLCTNGTWKEPVTITRIFFDDGSSRSSYMHSIDITSNISSYNVAASQYTILLCCVTLSIRCKFKGVAQGRELSICMPPYQARYGWFTDNRVIYALTGNAGTYTANVSNNVPITMSTRMLPITAIRDDDGYYNTNSYVKFYDAITGENVCCDAIIRGVYLIRSI